MVETLNLKDIALNKRLFDEAKRYIAGGVNSPVRSFKAVGGYPVFVKWAKGSKIYGECGRGFIDYCLSWGALILGHSHPQILKELKDRIDNGISFGTPTRIETELAEIINGAIPSMEKLRLTNSGTEAVMSAIRLARAYTKKNAIIRFEGSYHGCADYLLDCDGVPEDFKKYTHAVPYNDEKKAEEMLERHKDEVAAIIVEPVAANMGVVLPKENFLKSLRRLCDQHNILLIFDEVITGFRLTYGGAQKLFDVRPDLTCLGKIIGGGLPIGAFGGREDIMKFLAPEGNVYQAGTFSGNPLAVTAGMTTLRILQNDKPYGELEKLTRRLCEGTKERAARCAIKLRINQVGSIFSIFFIDEDVVDLKTAKLQDAQVFKKFFHNLLKDGIYFSPSYFEANFLSTAHRMSDIEASLDAIDKALKNSKR